MIREHIGSNDMGKDNYEYLFGGSGIGNLILAIYLIQYKNVQPEKILIVEKGANIGGLYMPWESKQLGLLDKGMHVYYECGIKEIDNIVYQILREDEWILLSGNFKDIAGAYFNGRLQKNTPYPDLRAWDKVSKAEYIHDIFQAYEAKNRTQGSAVNLSSCHEYWTTKFGRKLAAEIFNPIAQKLYGTDSKELNMEAAYITKLDRVVLFNEKLMEEIGKSEVMRSSLAYPEQLKMPNYRKSAQKGYYPRKGMQELVRQMVIKLKSLGVEFRLGLNIQKIENMTCNKLRITTHNDASNKDHGEKDVISRYFIWSGGLTSLHALCEIKEGHNSDSQQEKVRQTGLTSFVYHRSRAANWDFGKLYYAYSYDKSNTAFRITNMSSYSSCPHEIQEKNTFCVEYHLTEDQKESMLKGAMINREFMVKHSVHQLINMGILKEEKDVQSDALLVPFRVFPIPTQASYVSESLDKWSEEKIIYSGKGAKIQPFFLVDVLKSLHSQIK